MKSSTVFNLLLGIDKQEHWHRYGALGHVPPLGF